MRRRRPTTDPRLVWQRRARLAVELLEERSAATALGALGAAEAPRPAQTTPPPPDFPA